MTVRAFPAVAPGRLLERVAQVTLVLAAVVYVAQVLTQFRDMADQPLTWDFAQFHEAARHLAHGQDPYGPFLQQCTGRQWCQGGYIFPPLLAEILLPLAGMPLLAAARLWLLLSAVLVPVSVAVLWRSLRDDTGMVQLSLLSAATLVFYPLFLSFYFVQVAALLLLLLAVAAVTYVRGSARDEAASAVATGIAGVLRVTPILMAPAYLHWGSIRRNVGAVALAVTGIALVGTLWILTPWMREYVSTVLPRIGGGTPDLDNQSPLGLVNRALLLFNVSPSPVQELTGTAAQVVVLVIVVGGTWLAAQRMLRTTGDTRAARRLAFAAFIAAMPVASTISWQHHLVTEIVAFFLIAPALWGAANGPSLGVPRLLVIAAYPLMWMSRHITDAVVINLGLTNPTGWRVPPFLVITACNTLGLLCLWVATLLLMRRETAPMG